MFVNVEVQSREMIKPSSPTPSNLKTLKLSFLDQISPPVFVPMILFFQPDDNQFSSRAQISTRLKESLSDTLTRFYPLAGRINDNSYVNCDDSGVEFVEAQVRSKLSQIVGKPDVEDLKHYLPIQPYSCGGGGGGSRDFLLAVQLSFFSCGGLALGLCISHKIADGASLVTFFDAWASTARGAAETIDPGFDLASHFPPTESLLGYTPTVGITEAKLTTTRFVFDESELAALKKSVSLSSGGSQVKNPTRVEAVSAFFWRQFMDVKQQKMDTPTKNNKGVFVAVHAVNLRPRMNPPLPDNVFGNVWRHALAVSDSDDEHKDLVTQLRNSIRKIDGEYVERLKEGDWYLDNLKKTKAEFCKGEQEFCNFSSWCRFPVYQVDFGFGNPLWVSTTAMPFKNVVILMGTKSGDGMEAWVTMLQDEMTILLNSLRAAAGDDTKSVVQNDNNNNNNNNNNKDGFNCFFNNI